MVGQCLGNGPEGSQKEFVIDLRQIIRVLKLNVLMSNTQTKSRMNSDRTNPSPSRLGSEVTREQ